MNKKCSKINITDIMNLLAVTLTLNIQTCIVRLYNVKKNTQHNMYSQKKNQKEAFWYFREIQHFFFHYYVVPRPKK